MGPQEPDPFRFLTPMGRRLFVVSAVVAAATFFVLHSLDIDPSPQPLGTGRQPLYSLGIAFGLGIGIFVVGRWFLKRRGIDAVDDDNENLTKRWSERRTAVRSTFEMTSTFPLRATRDLVRRRSSCSR